MSLWFAPLTELGIEGGYFYLCPACHDELIAPELERLQNRILELHPAAARSLEEATSDEASDDPPADDSPADDPSPDDPSPDDPAA